MGNPDDQLRASEQAAASLVGLTKSQALQRLHDLGRFRVRLVDWDEVAEGENIMLTDDLRPDRVTVHVRGGVVTATDAG